ncbi:MAG: dehydrogenase, partial [Rhodospirillales bacterium]|nr:dehydrogenase [Rhodospirillales bacterium]
AETADAGGGEAIFLTDGTPIGQVTSGAYGYSVGKSLALGYVKLGAVKAGDAVHISILGRPHSARSLAEPPFDPEGLRLRDLSPAGEPAAMRRR